MEYHTTMKAVQKTLSLKRLLTRRRPWECI